MKMNTIISKNQKNDTMGFAYAMYMAVGSIFSGVNCLCGKERDYLKKQYMELSDSRDTKLEERCLEYVETVLKKKLRMDTGYEVVDCNIGYSEYTEEGYITFKNDRLKLDIVIGKEKEKYYIDYSEQKMVPSRRYELEGR